MVPGECFFWGVSLQQFVGFCNATTVGLVEADFLLWYRQIAQRCSENIGSRICSRVLALQKALMGFFFIFSDAGDSLNDCQIMFLTEIYKIEEPGSPSEIIAGNESLLKSRLKITWITNHLLYPTVVH